MLFLTSVRAGKKFKKTIKQVRVISLNLPYFCLGSANAPKFWNRLVKLFFLVGEDRTVRGGVSDTGKNVARRDLVVI
jgi:hypothetical protein